MLSYTTPIIEGMSSRKKSQVGPSVSFLCCLRSFAQHQPLSPTIHIQSNSPHLSPYISSQGKLGGFVKKDQTNHFFFRNYYINPHKFLHFDIVRMKIDVTPLLSGVLLSRHPLLSGSIFIKWLLMFPSQQLPPFNGGMTILLLTV